MASTNRYDGLDLTAMLLGAAAATHVYVTPAGSDTAAGTLASPRKTLAGAFALLPPVLSAPFVVHLASGSYEGATVPKVLTRGRNAFVLLLGDGAGVLGDDGFVVQATGTVDAGSALDSVKTTAALTASAHVGSTLEMLTGAAAGCRRGINENGASDVAPDYELTNAAGAAVSAAAGDTFRIVRPGVRINVPAAGLTLSDDMLCHLVNVGFKGTGRLLLTEAPGGLHHFWGVELDETVSFSTSAYNGLTVGASGSTQEYIGIRDAIGGPAIETTWFGWGIQDPSAVASRWILMVGSGCFAHFFLCSRNGKVGALGSSQFATCTVRGGRMDGLWLANGGEWRTNAITCPLLLGFLSVALSSRLVLYGKTNIKATSAIACGVGSQGQLGIPGKLSIDSAIASGWGVYVAANGELAADEIVVSMTGATSCAFNLIENSRSVIGFLTGVQTHVSRMSGHASLTTRGLTISGSLSTPAIELAGCARLNIGGFNIPGAMTLMATAPGSGALLIEGGAQCVVYGTASSPSISNLSTAPNSDGIRCRGEFAQCNGATANVTTLGSSGYGVNCRGGGRFRFLSACTGIVGPTADFSVGTSAGDDFADTALVGSFAARAAGMSCVQRMS